MKQLTNTKSNSGGCYFRANGMADDGAGRRSVFWRALPAANRGHNQL